MFIGPQDGLIDCNLGAIEIYHMAAGIDASIFADYRQKIAELKHSLDRE